MKNFTYILLGLTIGLTGCSSQKKLESNPPFTIGATTAQQWVGGREESGMGMTLKIQISKMKGEGVPLQSVYFRGDLSPLSMEMEAQGMMAVAKFEKEKPDIIMHADSTKEVGNKPPKRKTNKNEVFPFNLQPDEAVISYLENDKIKYTKITGIKEKQPIAYPTKPKN